MANLLNNPVYVTVQDVKDTSENSGVLGLTDAGIERLITQAQNLIDTHIYEYGTKYDENQDFIFPIQDEDWNSIIPEDIKIATIYAVENIYNNGASTSEGEVLSESLWYYKVTYSEGVSQGLITDNIKNLLDKYTTSFVRRTL